MCTTCYQESQHTFQYTDAVRGVIPLIQTIYEYSCVGGNLHVQLDDYNLDDEFFEEPLTNWSKASKKQFAVEKDCYARLKRMTYDERMTAMGIVDGIVDENGAEISYEPRPAFSVTVQRGNLIAPIILIGWDGEENT